MIRNGVYRWIDLSRGGLPWSGWLSQWRTATGMIYKLGQFDIAPWLIVLKTIVDPNTKFRTLRTRLKTTPPHSQTRKTLAHPKFRGLSILGRLATALFLAY